MSQALVNLATIRYLDINPLSVLSIGTLGLCIIPAFAISRSVDQHRPARQWAALVFALITIFFALEAMPIMRRGADADLSRTICLGFGLGFCLSAMRGRSLFVSIMAILISAIFVYTIAADILGILDRVLSEGRRNPVLGRSLWSLSPAVLFAAWLIAGYWIVLSMRKPATRSMRMHKGQCFTCAYNLRGSVGKANCPECGETIDWGKVVISEQP